MACKSFFLPQSQCTPNTKKMQDFHSHRSAAEDSCPLGYNIVPMCKWFPTFGQSISPRTILLGLFHLEHEDSMILRNIRNHLLNVSYPRRLGSWTSLVLLPTLSLASVHNLTLTLPFSVKPIIYSYSALQIFFHPLPIIHQLVLDHSIRHVTIAGI